MLGQRALLRTPTPCPASRPLAMPETRTRRPAVRVLGSLCIYVTQTDTACAETNLGPGAACQESPVRRIVLRASPGHVLATARLVTVCCKHLSSRLPDRVLGHKTLWRQRRRANLMEGVGDTAAEQLPTAVIAVRGKAEVPAVDREFLPATLAKATDAVSCRSLLCCWVRSAGPVKLNPLTGPLGVYAAIRNS